MAYRHNNALHKHQKRAKKIRITALVFFLGLFIGGSAIGIDWLLNQINNTETVVSSENTKSVQSANISIFRTEYFSFQATDDWVLVADQSSDNVFTYLKNSGPLVSQRVVFYVNWPVTTRVHQNISKLLEVDVDEDGIFTVAGTVGEHCDTSWPQNLIKNPTRIIHEGVEMECTPNTQEYNIILGQTDFSDRIRTTRENGEELTLTVVFSDLTAYPTPGDLYNIVSSLRVL